LQIDESEIETLYTDYKPEFDTLDWKKICIFEHHFSRSSFYSDSDSYEKIVQQKASFLDILQETSCIQNALLTTSKSTILERIRRKESSKADHAVAIFGHKRHLPDILETHIRNSMPEDVGIDRVVCLDCTNRCHHAPSLHIVLETQDISEELISDLSLLVESYVRKKHGDKCIEIVFLRKGCLESYTDKLGRTTRFELRDDILMKKLSDQIRHVWTATEEGLEEEDLGSDCQSCYGTNIPKPLNLGSFDVLTEWTMNVPILGQIILESYINKESMRRSENFTTFLNSKLKKLYCLFDSLLNILNKNYIGLLQDVNSQELAMNYQSINVLRSNTQPK
jgi:hypothetical protein